MHLTARGVKQKLFDIRIEMNVWHRKQLRILSWGEKSVVRFNHYHVSLCVRYTSQLRTSWDKNRAIVKNGC